MDVGVALPTMAKGFDRQTFLAWCTGIDHGPFSSISTGERITFFNPELITTLSAAAVLTERVDVMANIVVAPLHRSSMLAKQLATIDVLSHGRLVVGLGVGGRPHDYESLGISFERRHQRVDDVARELRSLWAGQPPFEGADPVGPTTVTPGGPRLLSGAMGPKALARAAQWADGVNGFSITGSEQEMKAQAEMARGAWKSAQREGEPWLGSGTFCVLGGSDPLRTLQEFGATYLNFFGDEVARSLAKTLEIASPDSLINVLNGAERAGLKEFTVVPGTWDLECLEMMNDAVASWSKSTSREEQDG